MIGASAAVVKPLGRFWGLVSGDEPLYYPRLLVDHRRLRRGAAGALALEGPEVEEGGGPGEPGAEADEGEGVARLGAALVERLREGDGDGGGRGVAVAAHVHDHLLRRQPHLLRGVLDDAGVGLVGDEEVDVLRPDAG